MAKSIKRKVIAFLVVLVLVVVAAGAVVLYLKMSDGRGDVSVGGGKTFEEVLNIGELATLEYRYRDIIEVIEEKELKIFGVDVDPRKQMLIVQYEGIMKLGIDCEKIVFGEAAENEDGTKRIEIILPPVELLSAETPLDTFEVRVDQGLWTKEKGDITTFLKVATERQEKYKAEVLAGDLADTALKNAKAQLRTMFESFSEIRDAYEFIWIDAAEAEAAAAEAAAMTSAATAAAQ